MNTPDPTAPSFPAAIPWYRSHVLQGILVAVIAQGILRLKSQYGIDLSQYAALGLDPNSIANWVIDIISAAALSYSVRARIVKPMPAVTANKTQAAAINAVTPPITLPKPPEPKI